MALIRQWVDEMLTAYGVFYYEGIELCLISSPLLRLTGGKGIKLRWIFLQLRKYGKRTSSASQSPMSRVGDGAAFSACNFAESGSPRCDHRRRRNRMWGRSDIWPDPPVELKIAAEIQP